MINNNECTYYYNLNEMVVELVEFSAPQVWKSELWARQYLARQNNYSSLQIWYSQHILHEG